ncbi:archease [Candidatus Micrarchaeota archaeon]|nr:archease [Candidatus Micrarchaeota archaeon]
MVKKYEFLEHKADVLYKAYGRSFEEALENAALALFNTIAKVEKLKKNKRIEIEERAKIPEELVAFVLSDLLSQAEINELFLKEFEVKEFSKKGGKIWLKGLAYGEEMTPDKGKTYVKAVTLHETKVEEKEGKWMIRVLLDI